MYLNLENTSFLNEYKLTFFRPKCPNHFRQHCPNENVIGVRTKTLWVSDLLRFLHTIYSSFVDAGDSYYLSTSLSAQREDYENYYNSGTRFHTQANCIILSLGYKLDDIEPILQRGMETRTVIESSTLKKEYMLEQEYIILPK